MIQTLKPIYDHDSYSREIEKLVYSQLLSNIFIPLFDIMEKKELRNASTRNLIGALRSGRLQYVAGFFIGNLNSTLSKELRGIGARYNKTRKAYSLERGHLPQDIVLAISEGNIVAKDKLKKVQEFLDAIDGRKLEPLEVDALFGDTVSKLDKQFHSTTQKLTGRDLEIPIAERLKNKLKEEYTENLNFYVQDWHDQQILKLRKIVSENVEQGFRASNLVQAIQAEKGVTFRKAKFLARQETSLMVSKYRQIRYEEIGLNRYRWSTSHDQRVRPDHRHLQGKIFRYDQPPVTDLHTMARNNPGSDFNCRCVGLPIITSREVLESNYENK